LPGREQHSAQAPRCCSAITWNLDSGDPSAGRCLWWVSFPPSR